MVAPRFFVVDSTINYKHIWSKKTVTVKYLGIHGNGQHMVELLEPLDFTDPQTKKKYHNKKGETMFAEGADLSYPVVK